MNQDIKIVKTPSGHEYAAKLNQVLGIEGDPFKPDHVFVAYQGGQAIAIAGLGCAPSYAQVNVPALVMLPLAGALKKPVAKALFDQAARAALKTHRALYTVADKANIATQGILMQLGFDPAPLGHVPQGSWMYYHPHLPGYLAREKRKELSLLSLPALLKQRGGLALAH